MKKNLFFLNVIFLVGALYGGNIQAQVTGQPAFKALKLPKGGLQKSSSKISDDLHFLYAKHLLETNKAQAKAQPDLPGGSLQQYIQIAGDRVMLDITLKESSSTAKADLEKIGFKTFAAYGRIISGSLPIDAISKLEAINDIKFAWPAYKPLHQLQPVSFIKQAPTDTTIKPVISQGDTAQRSYLARSKYKVNGKGVKVGVLSDSYNNLGTADKGVANGELPGPGNPFGFTKPVQVLQDNPAGTDFDEGRGMAEIIHDVAPGAEIAFHTANGGQANFANGILDLTNAGCKVITDDVNYYAEPFFQDGIIAQAVDKAKMKGVTYFSAAGNDSRQSYESDFRGSNFFLGEDYGTAHNFSAPGNAPVYFLPVIIPQGGRPLIDFQWDDPFYSQGGTGAKSDLDIYLLNQQGDILAYSARNNILNGDAFEIFDFYNTTQSTLFYILIAKYAGPDPKHLKFINYGDGDFYSTSPAIPGLRAGTIVGHAKAAGAIATGAAFFLNTPAYRSDTPRVEGFSSMGGTPNYIDTAGNRTYVRLQKPEITAPDGGNTSFFPPPQLFGANQDISQDADKYPNFFGTSAAAPHAAGIAALMIEAQKLNTITPDQIKGILSATAIDMNNIYTPGFDKGFDYNTGYGLVQADKAVGAVKFPTVFVKNLTIESVCSDNPDTKRNWKITNPNLFDVEAHWITDGSDSIQSGSIMVPPGEKTFSTKTAYHLNLEIPSIVVIDWKDNLNVPHVIYGYSAGAKCGEDTLLAKSSDKKLSGVIAQNTISKLNTVEVFPNPVSKNFKVYLSLNKPMNAAITLYSIDGKLLYQKTGKANGVIDIDASNYTPGIYILKIKQGDFNKTLKLVKQ